MKTDFKHTPGPWKIRFMGSGAIEDGFFVEAKNNNKPELGYGIEIMMEDAGDHNGYPLEQRLADAKLIAAAPELLEALIAAKKLAEFQGLETTETYNIINSAITKATE
jgi:hypothetical protein